MTFAIISGGFDLSVGAGAALASVAGAWLMIESGIPLGIAGALVAGLALGSLNGFLIAYAGVPLVTGEGQSLMKMTGTGEVFLADQAQDIHLVYLEGEKITVNGPNLLAFDAGIDWDIERVQGASGMMGGGLYNTSLQGTGWVAILSDGPPVLLNVASAPTFADAQAAITWSSGVSTSLKTDFKMKDFIGKSSGETLQMAFGGQGWVRADHGWGPATGTDGAVTITLAG